MKGKIKSEFRANFDPVFRFFHKGKQVQITLKEAEENALEYCNGNLAAFYENADALKAEKKKISSGKTQPKKRLNMKDQKRGTAFDGSFGSRSKVIEKAVAKFKKEQEQKIARLTKRFKKNRVSNAGLSEDSKTDEKTTENEESNATTKPKSKRGRPSKK